MVAWIIEYLKLVSRVALPASIYEIRMTRPTWSETVLYQMLYLCCDGGFQMRPGSFLLPVVYPLRTSSLFASHVLNLDGISTFRGVRGSDMPSIVWSAGIKEEKWPKSVVSVPFIQIWTPCHDWSWKSSWKAVSAGHSLSKSIHLNLFSHNMCQFTHCELPWTVFAVSGCLHNPWQISWRIYFPVLLTAWYIWALRLSVSYLSRSDENVSKLCGFRFKH